MNDTEQLFIVAAVWTVIAAVLVRFVPNWGGRIALFAILVGVPFWELPYGYLNFKTLCEQQGGLKVLQAVSPQQTICASYPFETSAERLLAFGFTVVEAKDKDGRVTTFSKNKLKTDSPKATSEYCVTQNFVRGLPWRIQRNEYVVKTQSNDIVAARHSDFVWIGTWWQEIAAPVMGRGGECRHSDPVKSIAASLLSGSK